MSNSVPFYIIDVFAESKYAGNQLAVVLDSDALSAEEMQRIAKEINFSETTFVRSQPEADGGYRVRIFTPEHELPFAGHPTIGTAYLIARELLSGAAVPEQLTLHLGVGPIRVSLDHTPGGAIDRLWMRQLAPTFGKTVDPTVIADVLGITPDDLIADLPVQEVSTGLAALIVPVRSLEAIQRIRTDRTKQLALVDSLEAKVVLAFCQEAVQPDHDLHVRVFVDFHGIPEDPATGSANGSLTAYLLKHRLYGDSFRLKAEQGYSIKRPSLLYLSGDNTMHGSSEVTIGGRCFLIAKGEWYIG